MIEAGKGMGMTNGQILWRVELPLSLPIIMAGIRTSTVISVGIATLAALIGAGGLGELIFRGLRTINYKLMLAGAIPAASLALLLDFALSLAGRLLTPKGLKIAR
jgi:osmoprotectant transport system permease protein